MNSSPWPDPPLTFCFHAFRKRCEVPAHLADLLRGKLLGQELPWKGFLK